MKLKSVVHESCPEALRKSLESTTLRELVLERVLRKHLRVGEFGPAEFYVQHCDLAVGDEPMCEVRLTGISVNTRRATDDFRNGLRGLEEVYSEILQALLPEGQKCQLFVSMMLDRPPLGESSSLLERDPIWVYSLVSSHRPLDGD